MSCYLAFLSFRQLDKVARAPFKKKQNKKMDSGGGKKSKGGSGDKPPSPTEASKLAAATRRKGSFGVLKDTKSQPVLQLTSSASSSPTRLPTTTDTTHSAPASATIPRREEKSVSINPDVHTKKLGHGVKKVKERDKARDKDRSKGKEKPTLQRRHSDGPSQENNEIKKAKDKKAKDKERDKDKDNEKEKEREKKEKKHVEDPEFDLDKSRVERKEREDRGILKKSETFVATMHTVALKDFFPNDETEISFREGDHIKISKIGLPSASLPARPHTFCPFKIQPHATQHSLTHTLSSQMRAGGAKGLSFYWTAL